MTTKFNLIFASIFLFLLNTTFGQGVTKKNLSDKWNVNLSIDSVKTGDTIVFKKDKAHQNYFFKSNSDLKRHTWYAHCGNKYFTDYFTPKPPDWETIGSWSVDTLDKKTILTLTINKGANNYSSLDFLFLSSDKQQFSFIYQGRLNIRGGRDK